MKTNIDNKNAKFVILRENTLCIKAEYVHYGWDVNTVEMPSFQLNEI